MNAQEFCYWLQGFIEVAKPETITQNQLQEIKNHLDLVLANPPINIPTVWIKPNSIEPSPHIIEPFEPYNPWVQPNNPFTITCSAPNYTGGKSPIMTCSDGPKCCASIDATNLKPSSFTDAQGNKFDISHTGCTCSKDDLNNGCTMHYQNIHKRRRRVISSDYVNFIGPTGGLPC